MWQAPLSVYIKENESSLSKNFWRTTFSDPVMNDFASSIYLQQIKFYYLN